MNLKEGLSSVTGITTIEYMEIDCVLDKAKEIYTTGVCGHSPYG